MGRRAKWLGWLLDKLSRPLPDACLLWEGPRGKDGYGLVKHNGKLRRVHRYCYELAIGSIPSGMYVCHKCDVPLCINPEHLFIGTARDNARDAVIKRRLHNSKKDVCKRGHSFSGDNLYINSKGERQCRKCFALRTRTYRQQRKQQESQL